MKINKLPLNLKRIVCLSDQYYSSRYERFQKLWTLTTSAINAEFGAKDITTGGGRPAFLYPEYRLMFNGVERAVSKPAVGASRANFVGALGTEVDDWYMTEIVAYDAAGVKVTNPAESLLQWWVVVDRNGQAKNLNYTIKQNSNYEWAKAEAHGVPPQYQWCKVPLADFVETGFPQVPRVPVPFSTVLPSSKIARVNYVPPNDLAPKFLATTLRGVKCTEGKQYYNFTPDLHGDYPRLPLRPGQRGVGTVGMITTLHVGRNAKIYAGDSWSYFRIATDGAKRTLFGMQHLEWPYWNEQCPVEYVGNWDPSIPPLERFPKESWGHTWWFDTTQTDTNAAPVQDVTMSAPEQPHLETPPIGGPVAFHADLHGYLLRVEYNRGDHVPPPKITRHCAFNDPWGVAGLSNAGDDTIYVAERQRHAVVEVDAYTGAKSDLLIDPKGATVGYIDGGGQFRYATGKTIADARACKIAFPEGLAEQDGFEYYASLAQGEVRRVNKATGAIEVCCRPPLDANSRYMVLAISDGTFMPRGTLFVSTWTVLNFGRPQMFPPGVTVDADGTTLTHGKQVAYQSYVPNMISGVTGSESGGYVGAVDVGHGVMACAGAGFGLEVYMQADATDLVPAKIDSAKLALGRKWWIENGELHWGKWGYNLTAEPLPWGQDPNADYALQLWGHTQEDPALIAQLQAQIVALKAALAQATTDLNSANAKIAKAAADLA